MVCSCVFRLQPVVKVSMVQTAVPVQADTRLRAPDTVRSDSTSTHSTHSYQVLNPSRENLMVKGDEEVFTH